MNVKKRFILIIALIALVSLMITPVFAETATGTLGGSGVSTSTYTQGMIQQGTFNQPYRLFFKNFELSGGFMALIAYPPDVATFNATLGDAPIGATIPVTFRISNASATTSGDKKYYPNLRTGRIVGTGFIGYQRVFTAATPAVELPGFFYVTTSSWNISTETGPQYIYLEYEDDGLFDFSNDQAAGSIGTTDQAYFVGSATAFQVGSYIYNRDGSTYATYDLSNNDGYWITGDVNKNVNGILYWNRISIINATSGAIITSDGSINSNTLPVHVINTPIYVSVKSNLGTYYNSSPLFGAVAPVTTPTLIPGYVRTYFENVDGRTNGQVHGSNLQLKDVEAGTWTNYTADADGNGYIDTPPGHTLEGYGTATGYTSASRTGLPTFSEGVYELIMWGTNDYPAPGGGEVNLIVLVYDKATQAPISGAELSAIFPNGSMLGGVTGSSGQEIFTVPNMSVIRVTASKAGYLTGTKTTTTTATGPDTIRIELSRQTITTAPTATTGPGGTTPIPVQTVDSRTANQKDQDMMNQIRDSGSGLVTLAIIATFCGLLGLMRKGM